MPRTNCPICGHDHSTKRMGLDHVEARSVESLGSEARRLADLTEKLVRRNAFLLAEVLS